MKELMSERVNELTIQERMKDMKSNIKKMANGLRMTGYGIMVMGMLWLSAPAEAQVLVDEVQPAATFQSTSAMAGSGSVYSSNPVLNEEGSAVYGGASHSAANAPVGPRRVTPINPGKDDVEFPLGDAVLPLLLMALLFSGVVALRRRVRE